MNTSYARLKRPLGSVVMLAVLLGGGCSGKAAAPGAMSSPAQSAARPPMAKTASNEFHYDDPCSLLEPKEVEAALGAPLGTPPYRGSNGNPMADGPDCIYQAANFEQIIFTVTFKDGAQAYRITGFAKKLLGNAPSESAKKAFRLDDGSELAGEWDEASLTAMNCCIFNALRADQLIQIDFTDSEVSLRQAAALVDQAFKRIDQPLALDGGANVAPAKAFLKTRPAEASPCVLLSKAEAEAILGPLAGPPRLRGTTGCEYPLPPKGGMPRSAELVFNWRMGTAAFRTDVHVGSLAGMALGAASKPKEEQRLPIGGPGDPWERGGQFRNDFVAIKKDVRVQIDERGGLDPSTAKALVAAAMSKL